MVIDIVMLAFSLGIILVSCAIFVNAIEWFGKALNLHQGIVGSILAAIGTALPETIIPVLALLFSKSSRAHEIGIGAIVGAPFMLATLGFFVTGTAVIVNTMLRRRTLDMVIDRTIVSRDLLFFFIYYGAAVAVSFFHDYHALKWLVALALPLSYVIYLKKTIESEGAEIERVEVLYLTRYFKWKTSIYSISFQLVASLAFIIIGAHLFINNVDHLARSLGALPLLLSLIITPIATELPEKLNSVIWVGKKKDTLALGNITGAMVFQSCFPVAFGIIATDWDLRGPPLASAVCALLSALIVILWIRIGRKLHPQALLIGGALYLMFMMDIFVIKHH